MLTDRRERRERPGADGTAGTAGTAGSAGSAGLPGARVRGPGIPRSEESDQCWESRTGVPRFYDGEVDQGPGTGVSRPRLFFMIPHCSPGTRTPMAESSMGESWDQEPGTGVSRLVLHLRIPHYSSESAMREFHGRVLGPGPRDKGPGTGVSRFGLLIRNPRHSTGRPVGKYHGGVLGPKARDWSLRT